MNKLKAYLGLEAMVYSESKRRLAQFKQDTLEAMQRFSDWDVDYRYLLFDRWNWFASQN